MTSNVNLDYNTPPLSQPDWEDDAPASGLPLPWKVDAPNGTDTVPGVLGQLTYPPCNLNIELEGPYGISGTPVPHTLRHDNALTAALLASFIVFVVALATSHGFLTRQLKALFYVPHTDSDVSETSGELRFLLFLAVVNCLLLAIGTYLAAGRMLHLNFMLDNHLHVALLFAMFAGYFLAKGLLGTVVNLTFFGGKKNLQWIRDVLLLTALEGVALFPAAVLLVYFDIKIENVVYYTVFVLVLNKILTFYRSWAIFFKRKGSFMQTFLYFCALEITPLLAFCGAGLMIFDEMKVNF